MPREKLNLAATMAGVVALTLCIGLTGAWAATRNVRPVTHLAKGVVAATPSPSPIPTPTEPAPSLPSAVQVVAPSSNVVWAVVDYQALFVSTDQGNSWSKRSLPAPPGGVRPVISFINDQEGWLLAPGVHASQCEEATADIWHTTDGAVTWRHLNVLGIAKSQCKDGVLFIDSQHGFVSAQDPNHRPTVYRTTDGGSSWIPSEVPDPPDFKTVGVGVALAVRWIERFGTTLYLEASDHDIDPASSRQYIFTSTDGAAWAWKQKVPPSLPVMVSEARWLLLTGPGPAQESTNGGQQWHPYQTDLVLDSPVFGGTQIVFADAQVGYETGRGALQRTSDGGSHWVRINTPGTSTPPSPTPSPIPNTYSAVLSAPTSNVVWSLVNNKYLSRSTDRGDTWQQETLPDGQYQVGPLISFVDDTTGFILLRDDQTDVKCSSMGAHLWRTTDGAKTWQRVADLWTGQCKDALVFADTKHGFLATGGLASPTMIWRTSDGGVTWSAGALHDPRLDPANGPPVRVDTLRAFGGTVLAYALPDVFRSTNAGTSWSRVAEVPQPMANDLAFVTAQRWLDLTSFNVTLDSGQTWQQFLNDYSQIQPYSGVTVTFADDTVGYATAGGTVAISVNGGVHWEMIKTSWP